MSHFIGGCCITRFSSSGSVLRKSPLARGEKINSPVSGEIERRYLERCPEGQGQGYPDPYCFSPIYIGHPSRGKKRGTKCLCWGNTLRMRTLPSQGVKLECFGYPFCPRQPASPRNWRALVPSVRLSGNDRRALSPTRKRTIELNVVEKK